jgi:FdhD protein
MKTAAVRSPRVGVRRWNGRSLSGSEPDAVAAEEPLEVRVETRPVAVIMRTPGHDEELAAGFLVSEGLLRERSQLREIRPYARNSEGNVLDVHLADGVALDLASLSRHVFASSSCGLCGRTTIAAVRRQFPRLRDRFAVTPEVLAGLPDRLRYGQSAFAETGGLHAAALFDSTGGLRSLREDVGRHNAVDKVIGRGFLDGGLPLRGMVLLVSGRVSFEIVEKALAAGVALVAAVSAPTGLAVELARKSGMTLVGFLRNGRFNVYSGAGRIARASRREVVAAGPPRR